MKLETDRLYLIPLTAKQLKLWIENCCMLEKEMNEIASQRLLKECGFEKYKQDDTAWWRL